MAVSGVSGYDNSQYNTGNRNIITTDDDNGTRTNTTGSGSSLGMTDFLALLSAQMSNQDMMNPVSDTDFIAQMAQFSALQGVNTLQEYVFSSYAVSYAGKGVIISHINETTRKLETVHGVVERVTFMNGNPKVVVDGIEYDLHEVMEVSNEPIAPPSDEMKDVLNQYIYMKYKTKDEDGELTKRVYGKVDRVTYIDGVPKVRINGEYYTFDPEMILHQSNEEFDPEDYYWGKK